MNNYQIYETISSRTNGDIYVGVVGPVRTGKSTFITRFMEKIVLPKISDKNIRARAKDEMPQAGAGKTIMTMQPRFVPSESIEINLAENVHARVRLVDCVGYLVEGAMGIEEDGATRLVKTPWDDKKIPFDKAAEIGTGKVINEHSTIGLVMTTDGTITEIPRESYIQAEERVVSELKTLGKPFVIILNTRNPESESTKQLAFSLSEKYGVPVNILEVEKMEETDFLKLLESVLYEFPIKKVSVKLPDWMRHLDETNEYISKIITEFSSVSFSKVNDYKLALKLFENEPDLECPRISEINLATGEIVFDIIASSALFYKTLGQIAETDMKSDADLIDYLSKAAFAKKQYEKLEAALKSVEENGYGIVVPAISEMLLSEPEITKRGQTSGLKLRATAPSLHIMKVDVETEVSPAVGGTELALGLMGENALSDVDVQNSIWNTNMFGKTMTELAHDGIISKIQTFPEEAQTKLKKTVTKITNEGKGGIICILL